MLFELLSLCQDQKVLYTLNHRLYPLQIRSQLRKKGKKRFKYLMA